MAIGWAIVGALVFVLLLLLLRGNALALPLLLIFIGVGLFLAGAAFFGVLSFGSGVLLGIMDLLGFYGR